MDAGARERLAEQRAWAMGQPLVDVLTLVRWELKHDVAGFANLVSVIQHGYVGPVSAELAEVLEFLGSTIAHMRGILDAVALPVIKQVRGQHEVRGDGEGI